MMGLQKMSNFSNVMSMMEVISLVVFMTAIRGYFMVGYLKRSGRYSEDNILPLQVILEILYDTR